jgi:DNA-binding MarR family transcriptional regulator
MARELAHLLRLQHLVRAELRHSLTDLDLTPVQNTVMHLISATPGSSSAELARHTHVTPQTMHKLVADLEQRGLLTLQPRPGHGRILDAHLTDQGRQVMADADKRAKAIEDRMVAGLDKLQRRQLSELLRHCVSALDTPAEEHTV